MLKGIRRSYRGWMTISRCSLRLVQREVPQKDLDIHVWKAKVYLYTRQISCIRALEAPGDRKVAMDQRAMIEYREDLTGICQIAYIDFNDKRIRLMADQTEDSRMKLVISKTHSRHPILGMTILNLRNNSISHSWNNQCCSDRGSKVSDREIDPSGKNRHEVFLPSLLYLYQSPFTICSSHLDTGPPVSALLLPLRPSRQQFLQPVEPS